MSKRPLHRVRTCAQRPHSTARPPGRLLQRLLTGGSLCGSWTLSRTSPEPSSERLLAADPTAFAQQTEQQTTQQLSCSPLRETPLSERGMSPPHLHTDDTRVCVCVCVWVCVCLCVGSQSEPDLQDCSALWLSDLQLFLKTNRSTSAG